MIDLDAIRDVARRNLIVRNKAGKDHVLVWEHSLRVANSALLIARRELDAEAVNLPVLTAAALYHEAGWIAQYRVGQISIESLLMGITTTEQRDLAAQMLVDQLNDVLPKQALTAAADCVRSLSSRHIEVLEVRLIQEADNLDECGALGLIQMVRRHAVEGKGVEDLIETWRTQRQYGFWDARINESMRFESVKAAARERIGAMDRLLAELCRQHSGEDLVSGANKSFGRDRG